MVEAWGAAGAGAGYGTNYNAGGSGGGFSRTELSGVTAGSIFTVVVGQGGQIFANANTFQNGLGYGGGGMPGVTADNGTTRGGGGGFSGIFQGTGTVSPLVVVGGGAGASPGIDGSGWVGGGGGIGAGAVGGSNSGLPGTPTAGGQPAASSGCSPAATAGAKWAGGTGAGSGEPGGGGGGGYFGGGGGRCQKSGTAQNGGGGGGSGFVASGIAVLAHGDGTSGNINVAGSPASVGRTLHGSGGQYLPGVGASRVNGAGDPGMVVFQWNVPPSVPPQLVNDFPVGAADSPQIISPLANDAAGEPSSVLVASTLKLCATTSTAPSQCNLTSLAIAGQGSYAVQSDGSVLFTPVSGFVGTVSAVRYVVQDSLAQFGAAEISTTVLPPPAAVTVKDLVSAPYLGSVSFAPLSNDSVTTSSVGYTQEGQVVLDSTSLRLCAANETADSCSQTVITTDAGTYQIDVASSEVTFVAASGFVGVDLAAPNYMVCIGISGDWQPQAPPETCSVGAIGMTVQDAPAPSTQPDSATGRFDLPVSINVSSNDSSATGLTLQENSVRLCPANETNPAACTQTTLTVTGGVFSADTNTGLITFTPVSGFSGSAPVVSYSIEDSKGTRATGDVSVSIQSPPASQALTSSGAESTTQSQILTIPAGGAVSLKDSAGIPVTFLDVAGGRYTLNQATGELSFFPDQHFSGTAPQAQILVTDNLGQSVTSTFVAIVLPDPPPSAPSLSDDNFSGIQNVVVSGDVTTNDTIPAGASITIVSNVSSGQLAFQADGSFTFTPAANFLGAVSFDYEVCHPAPDEQICSTASAAITIAAPTSPLASDDNFSGNVSQDISGTVAANDSAQAGSTYSALTQPANGTLVLQPNGAFVFSPNTGFVGADSFSYRVCLPAPHQSLCDTAIVNLDVRVPPPSPPQSPPPSPPPVVVEATAPEPEITSIGLPITVPIESAAVVIEHCLVDLVTLECKASVVVAGVGVFELSGAGAVVFTPDLDFVGDAVIPLREIQNGVVLGERPIAVSVTRPVENQKLTTQKGTALQFDSKSTRSESVCLVMDALANCQNSIIFAGVGEWSMNNEMQVVFTPSQDFVGESVVWLRITLGNDVQFQRFTASVSDRRPPVRLVLMDFVDGSPELRERFKVRITEFVNKYSDYRLMSCFGFTEGPTVLSVDPQLAMDRAINACEFAQLVRGKDFDMNPPRGFNETRVSHWVRRAVIYLRD